MRKLVIALVLAAAAACGGDSTSPVDASIAGTYKLQTMNGAPLPYTFFVEGNQKLELLDDQLVLTDGGTYAESGHSRTTINGQATTDANTDAGTYTRSGTAITFRSSADNSIVSGTISGSSVTVVIQGLSGVYTRQ
ncbi:MAG: Lipocalin-like domain protein [Gemmatimonadetes bacterium]|nr:Lipocalin-like domain protein [Gemmatimonadota bacterium]